MDIRCFFPLSGNLARTLIRSFFRLYGQFSRHLPALYWGRHPDTVSGPALIFFPCRPLFLCCGLAGLLAVKKACPLPDVNPDGLESRVRAAEQGDLEDCINRSDSPDPMHLDSDYLDACYLGGASSLNALLAEIHGFRREALFLTLFKNPALQAHLAGLCHRLSAVLKREQDMLDARAGLLDAATVECIAARIDLLKDMIWCLEVEIASNIAAITDLMAGDSDGPDARSTLFRQINAVLNSIDRLEVRGRDSAGISILLFLSAEAWSGLMDTLDARQLSDALARRMDGDVLGNGSIRSHGCVLSDGTPMTAISVVYKVAAEIGSLGDNIRFIRNEIRHDVIFQCISAASWQFQTISSHTRWASVGAITEPNCHPVDAALADGPMDSHPIIQACLNGDIDNYKALRDALDAEEKFIPEVITTDTKIIPLQIARHLETGVDIAEAFRLAVNDFEGSHAISMHTDLAPGRLFLAQRGSGQAVFVGLAKDHYMPASEVYGFIEETPWFLKMNGEQEVVGKNGKTQGQIFILDQNSKGGLDGVTALYYDGTPVRLTEADIRETEITTRDIDRQQFPHYFLKEISEAPLSMTRTLLNRWKNIPTEAQNVCYSTDLSETTFPASLASAISENRIRRIFFIGQGTAGVAAQVCADIFKAYLADSTLLLRAMKSSELSGFEMDDTDSADCMNDALIIAISQSGTTTDTNRAVDMVKARGGHTLAIVNRRDSDITFKVDGVFHTSTGRDIEMSVASTKAFYAQIAAGALLAIKVAEIRKSQSREFLSNQIAELLQIPDHMKTVLAMGEAIQASARRLAGTKTYWAAVGSGPNKSSADEIRIKLSELCYKTISSDYVEDKKHIDLSSEPLILVCAAGTKSTVIGDIAKDVAIFKAHKAAPVVIADADDDRFDGHAVDVFHVPRISSHFAPILNTLAGHIWGYHAALAIHEGSRFLHHVRESIRNTLSDLTAKGLDVYEIILEKGFREKIVEFYQAFRKKRQSDTFPLSITHASDLTLLFKYLSGRLPLIDFETDFGLRGTAKNVLDTFFSVLGESINLMARPVDAIKHQAKTVTVGTSRISERVEGIIVDALSSHKVELAQVTNRNVIVIKNIQGVVGQIHGSIFYEIDGLGLLGDPTDQTTIKIKKKTGVLADIPSRVETDFILKGTKRIIVQQGNVYIGKGRKDGRSIVVIPAASENPADGSRIRYLLLLNIGFKTAISLDTKIKALGGKYDHMKNIVQENNIPWVDTWLDTLPVDELFGKSAEKLAERIVGETRSALNSR